MEKWEGLLDGAAKPLIGHLTLERVTASKSSSSFFQMVNLQPSRKRVQ